jgi:DNA-binding response OmpR family regulator
MSAQMLFVEDDADLRDLLTRTFRRAGYQVTPAATGGEAVELLATVVPDRPRFDVVLSDIALGDREEIDGAEVMLVARRRPDPPEVILLTGQATIETAQAAVRAGAFDYVQKPCPLPRLLARVGEAVERQRSRVHGFRFTAGPAAADGAGEPVEPAQPTPVGPAGPAAEAEDGGRHLVAGALRIDTHRHEVWFDGRPLHVTPIEYTILVSLAATPERVVPYGELARRTHGEDLVWEAADAHDVLRHHVRNLRRKMDRRYLTSVRGAGYMLDPQGAGKVK